MGGAQLVSAQGAPAADSSREPPSEDRGTAADGAEAPATAPSDRDAPATPPTEPTSTGGQPAASTLPPKPAPTQPSPLGAESEGSDAGTSKTSPAAASTTRPTTLDEAIEGLDTTGTPPRPGLDPQLPPQSAAPGEERPLPNYDGRDEPPVKAEDVLIWIPRGLFYPVHLALEWGVRWPLVKMVTVAEEHSLAERLHEFFTWDEGRAGVYPGLAVDFGIRAHVGLQFFWNDLFWNTDVKASGFVGVNDLWKFNGGTDSHIFAGRTGLLKLRGAYERRPDNPYFGIGDLHRECVGVDPCRYRSAVGEVKSELVGFLPNLNRTRLELGFRDAEFSLDADRPSVSDEQAAEIPLFLEGYRLLWGGIKVEGDTRDDDVEFESGSGVRVEGWGYYNFDPSYAQTRFARWGAEVAGFWDFGHSRTIGLRLYIDNVENAGETLEDGTQSPIPFTELVSLGGAETMRGFLQDRMLGHRGWDTTLQYRYPILAFLDANLFASIGNAFDVIEQFDIERNFLAYGISFTTRDSRDSVFEMLLGFGSKRLDDPNFQAVDTVRFTFGINNGF